MSTPGDDQSAIDAYRAQLQAEMAAPPVPKPVMQAHAAAAPTFGGLPTMPNRARAAMNIPLTPAAPPPPIVMQTPGGAAAAGAVSPITLHGFGTRVTPAHEAALANPESIEDYRNATAERLQAKTGEEAATRGVGQAKGEAGQRTAEALRGEQDTYAADISREQRRAQLGEDRLQAASNDMRTAAGKLAEEGMTDPRAKESTLDAARWKLGEIFAGFAQGFQHQGGENPITAEHNGRIAEEIQRQKANMQAHRQSLEDLEKAYGFASQLVAHQQQNAERSTTLDTTQAKLGPEAAAAINQGQIGQAEQAVAAQKVSGEHGELSQAGTAADINMHRWVQPSAVGGVDRKAVAALAEKYDMEAAKAGRVVSPEDSTMRAMRLLYPGQVTGGPALPDISTAGKGTAGKAEIESSLSTLKNLGTSAATHAGFGTRIEAALKPGGTIAQDRVNQYNAMGAGMLKSVESRLPQEEAERVFNRDYALVPGLSPAQQQERMNAFQNHVRLVIGVKGKQEVGGATGDGGGGSSVIEPVD